MTGAALTPNSEREMNDTMHAIRQNELGGTEVKLINVPIPVPIPAPVIGEIVMRVHAAG
jgi:hypothetical protein